MSYPRIQKGHAISIHFVCRTSGVLDMFSSVWTFENFHLSEKGDDWQRQMHAATLRWGRVEGRAQSSGVEFKQLRRG